MMTDDVVRDLARLTGVSASWTDHTGAAREVSVGDLRRILAALGAPCDTPSEAAESRAAALRRAAARDLPPLLPAVWGDRLRIPADHMEARHARVTYEDGERVDFPLDEDHDGYTLGAVMDRPGYHRLEIGDRSCVVAVAPRRCVTAADLTGGAAAFGVTAQVYSLRTAGDGGVGTFAGVEALACAAAAEGADALGLSPTHALFGADPGHYSPYSPSTRLWLNPAYADPAATFGPARVAAALAASGMAETFARLEAGALVDWPAAGAARRAALRALWTDFAARELAQGDALAQDFRAFVAAGGEPLQDHARFETLHAHHYGAQAGDGAQGWDWRGWPAAHRDARSAEVARFAQDHADETLHHCFLQWLAARSQAAAQRAARAAGMRIGLIGDLAVGVHAGGSQTWSRPGEMLVGLSVGAPPDPLAPRGQSWGLTTFSPLALRDTGYAAFIATLRNMLRHAGGVRIDHVMGLARLWVTPEGEDASHGAYVAYPFETLVRLVALESHRARAIVIGEDLGTAPHGFRERLGEAGIYGLRVAFFERSHDAFNPPHHYAHAAAAMTSTHDTPTVAGWWRGADVDLRAALDQFGPGQTHEGESAGRDWERGLLWRAISDCGAATSERPDTEGDAAAVDAAVAFVARSASQLALFPVEDLVGSREQVNLPGTTDQHPNWRRRLDADARRLLDPAPARARLAEIRRGRGVDR